MMIISHLTIILSFLVCIFCPQVLAQVGVERGLSFTRSIDEIPGSFDLLFDGHPCNDQDEHGDNDCHFEWGADVTGGYKLYIDRDIDVGDRMTGHFKIDRLIPYSFTCALCGEDCVLTVPVVKFTYTIPLPPCPVPAHTIDTRIEYKLQPNSPTDGILTHLEGAIEITSALGERLADFSISVYVK